MAELYVFCEPAWATTRSHEHIRRVVRGEVKLGGGNATPALCGFDLARGWDLPGEVTTERIERGLTAECNPTCPDCAAAWTTATHPAEQPERDA